MKKRNRMLAILLAFTMVLTFMPMLAFAEGEEADAEPQVTEAAAETEAVEELAQEEALDAEAEEVSEPEIQSLEFIMADGFDFDAVQDADWLDYYGVGNRFIVHYVGGGKKEFQCVTFKDSAGDECYEYFEGGNINNEPQSFTYWINGKEEGTVQVGNNTVVFFYNGVASSPVTFVGKKLPAELKCEYKETLKATIFDDYDDLDIFPAGSKFSVTYKDGSSENLTPTKDGNLSNGTEEFISGWQFKENYDYENSENPPAGYKWKERFSEGENYIVIDAKINNTYVTSTQKVIATKPEGDSHKCADYITTVSAPATCQAAGIKKHFECIVCHKMYSDAKGTKELTAKQIKKLKIKQKKHNFKKKSDEYVKSPATCTKKATYYYACTMCGAKGKKTYTGGSLLPHDLTKFDKVEATCQHGGMKEYYKCSICKKLYASQTAKKATTAKKLKIKKLKHKFNAKLVEDKYKAKKAGMYYYSCSMCGAKGRRHSKRKFLQNNYSAKALH